MPVVILIPVLRRPHNVVPLLESIEFAGNHAYLFLASPGDEEEIAELERAGANYEVVSFPLADGDYARKINYGAQQAAKCGAEFIFTGADDLLFHEDWFDNAMAVTLPKHGVIGTNDLANPRVMEGKHSTHSIVRLSYVEEHGTVDERGKVLHEGYPHEFVDDELVWTARRRGAWVWARDSHVEHMHPHFRKVATDEIYDRHEVRMRQGRRVWDRRRTEFGLC
jgi:hypothetical protein